MPILDHFGIIAPLYDRLIPLRHAEKLTEMADLPTPGVLLDAGGGTGRVSEALKNLASQTIVADLSLGMLNRAASKKGLRPVCSLTESLPFPDASIDRIIMVDALHHVCSHVQTATEIWRVLRPGGRIVIEEPDVRTFIVKLVAVAEKMAFMRSHFIIPVRIAELFPYSNAQIRIEKEGYNAWVIIDKIS